MHFCILAINRSLLALFCLFNICFTSFLQAKVYRHKVQVSQISAPPQKLVSIPFKINGIVFDEKIYNVTFYFNSTDNISKTLSSDDRHLLVAEFDHCELVIYPTSNSDNGIYWIQLTDVSTNQTVTNGYTQLQIDPNGRLIIILINLQMFLLVYIVVDFVAQSITRSQYKMLDAVVGRRATLVCDEPISSSLQCSWRRHGQANISPVKSVQYFGGRVLALYPVNKEDFGMYSCRCPPHSSTAATDVRIEILGVPITQQYSAMLISIQ